MIISRTPYRISFFGGGTDFPAWYQKEGGAVLSTTIDKYCYISCRFLPPFFDLKHRIVWSYIEHVHSISEILHPAVREGLRMLKFDDTVGLEIHHEGDLPARSGIGSSSTFSVGLIKALMALRNGSIIKHQLALKAIEFEQNILKENVGCQDQVAAAYGGLNVIRFSSDGQIIVEPVKISEQRLLELQSRLVLVYSGTSRLSSEMAGYIVSNMNGKRKLLFRMADMVNESLSILSGDGSMDSFGELLHEGWMLKRELSEKVTNSKINRIYDKARKGGALGGKLLGAGSAGFMVFYVPPEKKESVLEELSEYLHVPFKFENTGSTIIYNGVSSESVGVRKIPLLVSD